MLKLWPKKLLIFFAAAALVILPARLAVAAPDWTLPNPVISFSKKIEFQPPAECGASPDGKTKYFCIPWLAEYVKEVYNYAIGIVGIVAAIAMVIGGFIWMTAGGNASRVGDAKTWIGSSLMGLLIALGSYMIMFKINPDLVAFKPLRVAYIEPKNLSAGIDMSRYTGCKWLSAGDQCTGGSFVDNKDVCQQQLGDPPENVRSGMAPNCCCAVAPVSGCHWSDICDDEDELLSAGSCGTYWGGPDKCCCAKGGSGQGCQSYNFNNKCSWNADIMSCICMGESSGQSGNIPSFDKCKDGGSLSYGSLQVNVVAHRNRITACNGQISTDGVGNQGTCLQRNSSGTCITYNCWATNGINSSGYQSCILYTVQNQVSIACDIYQNQGYGAWSAYKNCD